MIFSHLNNLKHLKNKISLTGSTVNIFVIGNKHSLQYVVQLAFFYYLIFYVSLNKAAELLEEALHCFQCNFPGYHGTLTQPVNEHIFVYYITWFL